MKELNGVQRGLMRDLLGKGWDRRVAELCAAQGLGGGWQLRRGRRMGARRPREVVLARDFFKVAPFKSESWTENNA